MSCVQIARGMSEQRSTDLGAVKHTGLSYLMPNHEAKVDKSDRGFNHVQLTQMLCPRKKLIVFDKDPDAYVLTFPPMGS